MQLDVPALLDPVNQIAESAGRKTMEFHGQELMVEVKADNSPLTLADKASHQLIVAELERLTPEIPVVSEESAEGEAISLASDQWLWLVDPLDGTKEFIKQTGQFTVNIGLVHNGFPVLGIVHVPVSGTCYQGINTETATGAWIQQATGERAAIETRAANLERLTVVASRDHAGPAVEAFLKRISGADVTNMGSSLKFCLVAEGKADFYPRVVPTFQWDTAAAQAIVEAAGGHLTEFDGERLTYRKDRLRNPAVMAFGDNRIDWPAFFNGS
ncbi:MAG: 3'(2'),5'-bisphosphate nucleotidase CysQ [Planctomycetota bacterium]